MRTIRSSFSTCFSQFRVKAAGVSTKQLRELGRPTLDRMPVHGRSIHTHTHYIGTVWTRRSSHVHTLGTGEGIGVPKENPRSHVEDVHVLLSGVRDGGPT